MDDTDSPDPGNDFSGDSSWTVGAESDSVYFIGSDKESSILSEFGWNLLPEQPRRRAPEPGSFADAEPIDSSDLAGRLPPAESSRLDLESSAAAAARIGSAEKAGDASTSNPSLSSTSSEDPPEKSTGSGGGGKPPETP